jgi:DNA-binding NtrC family response regulator
VAIADTLDRHPDNFDQLEAVGTILQQAKNSPSSRILVVDDELLIRWSLAQALTDGGYEVVEAANAGDAVSAVRNTSEGFDVVLLDFRLPDSADLSLLASLRRLAPYTQIVLMTAFATPELVQGALDLGAFQVVGKPFEVADMMALVARAAEAVGR